MEINVYQNLNHGYFYENHKDNDCAQKQFLVELQNAIEYGLHGNTLHLEDFLFIHNVLC